VLATISNVTPMLLSSSARRGDADARMIATLPMLPPM